jgi:hypothetical protein
MPRLGFWPFLIRGPVVGERQVICLIEALHILVRSAVVPME